MSEKKEDKFENGVFWEYYMDLERQFWNFLEYVPYLEGNEKTYSFRLANLILAIGAHIDSAFKEMFRYPDFAQKYPSLIRKIDKNKANIVDYHVIEKEYPLSQRKVVFKRLPEREPVMPFHQYVKVNNNVVTPDWWQAHNKIKHKFSQNFTKANLKNARDALAGAFLLNVRHIPAIFRFCDYALDNVLKLHKPFTSGVSKYPLTDIPDRNLFQEIVENKQRFSGRAETFLFIYDYEQ